MTDIHVPGRFRTRNPNRRVTADLQLRRRGHWNRLFLVSTWKCEDQMFDSCDYGVLNGYIARSIFSMDKGVVMQITINVVIRKPREVIKFGKSPKCCSK